ncbi:hypothetical protein OOT46_11260 [Aquabacterium sp. A7-Y]|uniref:DUF7079 family protein n=1 Tax=Aquabacterium sp. A7-Y TaxID=1349605 RepID=UPI00223E4E8E|nr:hypothetical protein [Aquabacterium sp. A7-Y]MCW7538418.1 hypothetical protein [Aquabacterium sp. A7-Y]
MALTPEELTRRAPVWIALSDLFVGKELQDYDIRSIADRLLESGFTLDDIESILRDEVAPVFGSNLGALAVTEMEGWNDAAVIEAVSQYLSHPPRWLQRQVLQWKPADKLVESRWRTVLSLITR